MATQEPKTKDHFELYKQYTTNLRNWFVIYGVGGIVVFATHPDAFADCTTCQKGRIAFAFLVGVFIQIVVAYINKYANLHLAMGEDNASYKNSTQYKKADKWSDRVWIDTWADRLTIGVFLWAAIELIIVFACSNPSTP